MSLIVMVIARARFLVGPFLSNLTMMLLYWIFKGLPAAGRRPSGGASCSCGNLCLDTMEEATFSQGPALPFRQKRKATHHNNNSLLLSSRGKSPLEGK